MWRITSAVSAQGRTGQPASGTPGLTPLALGTAALLST